MGLFEGKKGLILGVANDRSIAWAIAERIMQEGGLCGFTHLPDHPYEEKKKNRHRVARCLEGWPQAKFLMPLDVQDDHQVADVMPSRGGGARQDRLLAALDRLRRPPGFGSRHDQDQPGRFQTGHGRQRLQPDRRGQRRLARDEQAGFDTHRQLFRRREVRAGLQRDGDLQGGPGGHRPVSGPRLGAAWRAVSTRSAPGR